MAKFTIEVEPVADDSELRRQLNEALAAVEEWKATVGRWADVRDVALTERDTARAENERLRGELAKASKADDLAQRQIKVISERKDRWIEASDHWQRKCNAAIADRETMVTALARANKRIEDLETREQHGADSAYAQRATVDRLARELDVAIAERDEARKALADRGGVTLGIYANACRTRDEAFAELTTLRARVAELETEKAKAKALDAVLFVTPDQKRWTAAEYYDFTQTRIAELEKTIEAAKVNPLTLFNGFDADSRVHPIDARRSFVGLVVDIGCGAGVVPGAIKMLAAWL